MHCAGARRRRRCGGGKVFLVVFPDLVCLYRQQFGMSWGVNEDVLCIWRGGSVARECIKCLLTWGTREADEQEERNAGKKRRASMDVLVGDSLS